MSGEKAFQIAHGGEQVLSGEDPKLQVIQRKLNAPNHTVEPMGLAFPCHNHHPQ